MGASMSAQAVLRAVRQKEGDNNAVKYSDYDILCAINEVLRYLNVDLSNKQAECLRHIREYDEDQENDAIRAINEAHMGMVGYVPQGFEDYKKRGAKLPDDFVSLISVQRLDDLYAMHPAPNLSDVNPSRYYVAGGRIFVPCKSFRMTYYMSVSPVMDVEKDTIDLPDIFFEPIVKLVRLVLNNGDADAMTQAVNLAVDEAIPKRRYKRVRQKMPFYL